MILTLIKPKAWVAVYEYFAKAIRELELCEETNIRYEGTHIDKHNVGVVKLVDTELQDSYTIDITDTHIVLNCWLYCEHEDEFGKTSQFVPFGEYFTMTEQGVDQLISWIKGECIDEESLEEDALEWLMEVIRSEN